MMDAFKDMYDVVVDRRANPQEGSYTCYLFDKGIDKILKKCGEECTEMVIAAKNSDKDELANEINDLLYHMIVMMVDRGVTVEDIEKIMVERSKKIGNLKQFHVSDHNTLYGAYKIYRRLRRRHLRAGADHNKEFRFRKGDLRAELFFMFGDR